MNTRIQTCLLSTITLLEINTDLKGIRVIREICHQFMERKAESAHFLQSLREADHFKAYCE